MATIRDIARLAGVSKSTVSNVLNGNVGTYSEETRRKVVAAMRALNYRPNAVARSLASNQTSTVGVLLSDIGREPYARALQVIEGVLSRRGYNIVVANTFNDPLREERAVENLLERRIDGLLFVSFSGAGPNDHLVELAESTFPLVVINRAVPRGLMDSVHIDNSRGVADAVAHLARLGHRNVGCIHLPLEGPKKTVAGTERMAGFRQGMEQASLPLRLEWIREAQPGEVNGLRSGFLAATELLSRHPKITALVCANDYIAIGAIRAAWRLGRRVPVDLAVVGHDHTVAGRYHVPSVSTVAQPMTEAATVAAARLLDRIEGRSKVLPALDVSFSGRFIVGGSTDPNAPDPLIPGDISTFKEADPK